MKHSRIARYEILWEFLCEADWSEEAREILRQTLTYDLYARDYVKKSAGLCAGAVSRIPAESPRFSDERMRAADRAFRL